MTETFMQHQCSPLADCNKAVRVAGLGKTVLKTGISDAQPAWLLRDDVGFSSLCFILWEHVLLPLVNKEVDLANSQNSRIELGRKSK